MSILERLDLAVDDLEDLVSFTGADGACLQACPTAEASGKLSSSIGAIGASAASRSASYVQLSSRS